MNTNLLFPILIPAIIAIISWFIIAYYNRKLEIFKKLLDLRIQCFFETLELFEILAKLAQPNIVWQNHPLWPRHEELTTNIRIHLKACGKEDEIKKYDEFGDALGTKNLVLANKAFVELQKLFKNNLRKELGLKSLQN